MQTNELQEKLVAYMDAATDLAEQIREDLRKGDSYSNETVLKLSRYIQEAEKLNSFVVFLNTNMLKLN